VLACDGAAAVEAVALQPFDLVLMDCQMPVMDGFMATRQIRAAGQPHSSLPIIALTASATPEHLARCDAAGMDGHLTKPLNPGALEAVLKRYAPSTADNAQPSDTGRDITARRDLEQMFGGPAVASLLHVLLDQLQGKLPPNADLNRLREEAHTLRGGVGMLGYDELSEACGALEQRIEDGLDHDAALARARALIRVVEADARAWLADLARVGAEEKVA
jgi:CheY-like chemotaxis protein